MIDYYCSLSQDNTFLAEGFETCTETLEQDQITIFVQGLLKGKTLKSLLEDYQKSKTFSPEGLEGSFVLGIIDRNNQSVLLYRHMVGSTYTFYAPVSEGFCFGSNLATVARRSGLTLKPNEEMLPAFFLYRFIPDIDTLFKGIYKLMPGEIVSWKKGVLERKQLITIESLLEPHRMNEKEAVERINATFNEIMKDYYALEPKTTVLLSGGVDSMIVQVHWDEIWEQARNDKKFPSASVILNHPYVKVDIEYINTAVDFLKTDHLGINQEPLTSQEMLNIFSNTGIMPSHVQSFYFATLAEGMKQAGWKVGISGEGADGLLGNGDPETILQAMQWSKKIPISLLRYFLSILVKTIKPKHHLPDILNLCDHIDDLDYAKHPQNLSVAFTDLSRVQEVFGKQKTLQAMAFRRHMLDQLKVPDASTDKTDPLSLQRALTMAFFGDAIETAATWTSMFHLHDVDMYVPFLDSRIIRVASNISTKARFVQGEPKRALKKALAQYVPEDFINRPKRGFGQPIFEWLSPGGCLREAVEKIDDYPWLPKKTKQEILEQKPNWFLWSLLCYDLWHKTFISQ